MEWGGGASSAMEWGGLQRSGEERRKARWREFRGVGRDAEECGEVRKGTEEWGGVRRGGRNGVKCGAVPRSAMECG
eukprot:2930472-Pyramimonas_sp.AAC.1